MMANSWEQFLNGFQGELDKYKTERKENSTDFEQIPPGVYAAKIALATLTESKAGAPMVKFEFVLEDGPYANRREWLYRVLEAGRIKYLMWDLEAAGLVVDNMAELTSKLRTIIDTSVNIEIKKTQGKDGTDYRNINITRKKVTKPKKKEVAVGYTPESDLPF